MGKSAFELYNKNKDKLPKEKLAKSKIHKKKSLKRMKLKKNTNLVIQNNPESSTNGKDRKHLVHTLKKQKASKKKRRSLKSNTVTEEVPVDSEPRDYIAVSENIEENDDHDQQNLPVPSNSYLENIDSDNSSENVGSYIRMKREINVDDEKDFELLPLEEFSNLIAPMKTNEFFEKFWEDKPLLIVRNNSDYFTELLTSSKLDSMIRNNPLYYTKNIDVVSYESGEKKTHNPEGRAIPASVWDFYSNNCSIRLLNPQTYNKRIRVLLANLQEYFGTMAGANVYLTPPGSQGFAPHFDDIEAFVLQIEGKKHWKIYKPQTIDCTLPRYSSRNFDRNELGTPMELTVQAGDLLYFPRGYIHEAQADEESHSLHITVSVYQNTAYVDLIEKLLVEGLRNACRSNVEFRRGLPRQYLRHLGIANSELDTPIRKKIISTVKDLVTQLPNFISVDNAADQLGRKFMFDALPPQISTSEKYRTSKNDADFLENGVVKNMGAMEPDTFVRLVRYHALRLVVEDGVNKLYYCTENANVYHGEEEQVLELDDALVGTVRGLLQNYPKYVKVEDLPSEDDVAKIHAIADLWEKGLIVTKEPLPIVE